MRVPEIRHVDVYHDVLNVLSSYNGTEMVALFSTSDSGILS